LTVVLVEALLEHFYGKLVPVDYFIGSPTLVAYIYHGYVPDTDFHLGMEQGPLVSFDGDTNCRVITSSHIDHQYRHSDAISTSYLPHVNQTEVMDWQFLNNTRAQVLLHIFFPGIPVT